MPSLTLEGGGYRLEVDSEAGAIVRSLTWRGLDVLRPSPEGSNDPLDSASFPLVPFSNRLSEDPVVDGTPIRLPRYMGGDRLAIHGFGWKRKWEVSNQSSDMLELTLEDRTSPWPSSYRAVHRFTLDDASFTASLSLTNIGTAPMPAGIGFHPYFPRGDAEMRIGLEGKWEQDPRGLPEAFVPSGWDGRSFQKVADTRLDHSFSGWDGKAQIRWPKRDLAVAMSASESVREAVIYVPEDDYFCVEPVSHLTNAMFANDKAKQRGWRVLAPGETLQGAMVLRASTLA